ncbi:MAG: SLC13 family permease [Acetatifactor sp.]
MTHAKIHPDIVTFIKFIAGLCIVLVSCFAPIPEGLSRQGTEYLGILLCMIFYLMVNLCNEFLVVLFALGMCAVLKITPFTDIFSAFSNTTVWLLVGVLPLAYFIGRSGLLNRIALIVMKLFPNTYSGQLLALTAASLVISPLIPSITAKATVLAPFAVSVAKRMGFENKSKGLMGLFMIVYIIGAVSGHVFYSGSMNVFILLGLLPQSIQDSFTWGSWLQATFIWGLCVYVLCFLAVRILFRPDATEKLSLGYSDRQMEKPGPMTASEKRVAIVLMVTLVGWMTKSIHGIQEAAIAIIAFLILALTEKISNAEFRGEVAWDMIIFIGGLMCMASVMSKLQVDAWIAKLISPLIQPMLCNTYVFVIVLSLLVALSRYVIVSAVSAVSLFYIVFSGPAQSIGISPWVTGFIIVTIGQLWSTPFNSTTYLASVAVLGEDVLDFKQAVKMSHVFVVVSILGFLLSIPLWRQLGLIR